MKKMNGFTITRLALTGFKCFEDTVTFDFGDMTLDFPDGLIERT